MEFKQPLPYQLKSIEDYKTMLDYFQRHNYTFAVVSFRKQQSLLTNGAQFNYTAEKKYDTNKEVVEFHKVVGKSVHNYINSVLEKEGISEIKPELELIRSRNYNKFDEIPIKGTFFNYDFESSYWQMMRKMNIINEKTYKKYNYYDDFKKQKAMCIGMTTSCKRVSYYQNGQPLLVNGMPYIIKEVKECERILYHNVRTMSSNFIAGALKVIGNDYVMYTIDSVACSPIYRDKLREYFRTNDIDYKIEICHKVGECSFSKRGHIVNF